MMSGNDTGQQDVPAPASTDAEDAAPRRPSPPLPPGTKIKVLFLLANPPGTQSLDLPKEIREIEDNIHQSEFRDSFDLKKELEVRTGDLQKLLTRHNPHIVHFSGHGTGQKGLFLHDDEGRPKPVGSDVLKKLFELRGKEVRVVVLNACESLRHAEAIANHVDVAIRMNGSITDAAAIMFAPLFYLALGSGDSVQEAFDSGRLQLESEMPESAHIPGIFPRNGTPLYLIARDNNSPGSQPRPDQPKKVVLPVNPDPEARAKYKAKLPPKLLDLLNRLLANEKERCIAEIHTALKMPPITGTVNLCEAIVGFMLDTELAVPRLERFLSDSSSLGNEASRIVEECLDRIVPWHFPDNVVQAAAALAGPDRPGFLQGVVVTRFGAELVMAALDQESIEINNEDDERPGKHGSHLKDLPAFGSISLVEDAKLFLDRVLTSETREGRDSELEWYREQTGRSKYCVVQLSLMSLSLEADYAIRLLEEVSRLQPGLPIFCLTEAGLAKDREFVMLDTLKRRRKASRH